MSPQLLPNCSHNSQKLSKLSKLSPPKMGRTQQYVRLSQFENLERVNVAIIEKLDTQETQIKTLTDELATLKALFEDFQKVPGVDEATQCFGQDDVANLNDFEDTEALKYALRPDLECVKVYPSTFDLPYHCSAEDPDMIVWQWSLDTRDFVKVGTFNIETEDESEMVIWLDGCDPRPLAEGVQPQPVAYDNQVDIQVGEDVDDILLQIVAQVDEETKKEKKEKKEDKPVKKEKPKKPKKDKPKKEKEYPPEVAKARADYESLYEKKARSNASLATLLKKIAEKDNGEGVGF